LIVALAMIVRHEFGERTQKWRSLSGIRRSRHSSLIERTNRSAYALQFVAVVVDSFQPHRACQRSRTFAGRSAVVHAG
jgi:hypothetical protein